MSDEIDRANDYAALMLESQIAAARINTIQVSAFTCECCGKAIPEARRRAVMGCVMCIDCQSVNELKNKHYRSV